MPAALPWEEGELQTLVSNPESRIFLDQKRIPVVLQPFHLQDLKSAVRDLLNASVDNYDKSYVYAYMPVCMQCLFAIFSRHFVFLSQVYCHVA